MIDLFGTNFVIEFLNQPIKDIAEYILQSKGKTKDHTEDNGYIDIILIALYKNGASPLWVDKDILMPVGITLNETEIGRLSKITCATGYAVLNNSNKPNEYRLKLNDKGFNFIRENGSWLNFLQNQENEKRKTNVEKNLTKANIVATIVFGVSTAILGIIAANNNRELNKKDKEIENLNHRIDTLIKVNKNVR